MLPLSHLDRFCAATLAGAFGVRVFLPIFFEHSEFRRLCAGVANCSHRATNDPQPRAGMSKGNYQDDCLFHSDPDLPGERRHN